MVGNSDEGDSKKALIKQPADLKSADELKRQAVAEPTAAEVGVESTQSESAQVAEEKEKEESAPVVDTSAAKLTQGALQSFVNKTKAQFNAKTLR